MIVPTCQRSTFDLVRVGESIENEKDRLLERVSSADEHERTDGAIISEALVLFAVYGMGQSSLRPLDSRWALGRLH